MIVRLWHGKTSTENAEAYMNYVMQTGVKDYRATPGNLNARFGKNRKVILRIYGRFRGG